MILSRRTGLWMRKLGMSRIFTEDGTHIPVTVLHLDHCHVMGVVESAKRGYDALWLGFGQKKEKNIKKPIKGTYKKAMELGVESPAFTKEFRIGSDKVMSLGTKIDVGHFVVGQKVDVRARTKGRGFSGVIKRHNFSGLGASHGVSISHRSHGSTGHSQDPGRVFKGKKMAGHYGDSWRTVQNLEIVSVDKEASAVFVKGAVPGAVGGYVEISDAIKYPTPQIEEKAHAEPEKAEGE